MVKFIAWIVNLVIIGNLIKENIVKYHLFFLLNTGLSIDSKIVNAL